MIAFLLLLTSLFVAFMVGNSTRNVSVTALSTRVAAPAERARFLSTQSAVQHLAAAAGAALSTRILSVSPEGRLVGMRSLVLFSAGLSVTLPFLSAAVARRLRTTGPSTAPGKDDFLPRAGTSPSETP